MLTPTSTLTINLSTPVYSSSGTWLCARPDDKEDWKSYWLSRGDTAVMRYILRVTKCALDCSSLPVIRWLNVFDMQHGIYIPEYDGEHHV